MNPHGHHDVADDAGLPALARAFARSDKGVPRLTAFYLGNWLTDVAQLYDPVVFGSAERALADEIKAFSRAAGQAVDDTLAALFIEDEGGVPSQLEALLAASEVKDVVGGAAAQVKAEVDAVVRWFYDGKASQWLRQELASVLFVTSYFKFVHPVRADARPRMDFAAYGAVFQDRFTQYFPHEHLDRPPVLTGASASEPPRFRSERASGTVATGEALSPDLYQYLREDIQVAAGTLAEIELGWAARTFRPDVAVDDADPAWNVWLARFGHALHGGEDFFAHSNFIEHAALRLGPDYFKGRMSIYDQTALLRRFKQWRAPLPNDWTTLPDDNDLVTGIFDKRDTLFSLLHLGEELFGLDVEDPFRDDPDQRRPEDDIT